MQKSFTGRLKVLMSMPFNKTPEENKNNNDEEP